MGINPRRFLTPEDLDSIRDMFPQAAGVEVLIVGYIIILFRGASDVEEAYQCAWPLELAGLRFVFDIRNMNVQQPR